MKTIVTLFSAIMCFALCTSSSFAQQNENRTKIQMTISFEGKEIVADLTSLSTSFSRNLEPTKPTGADSVALATPAYDGASLYISINALKVTDDLLRVLAKKSNRFDGTITVIDSFGRNATQTITFKKAAVYSFSQQASNYGEGYGDSGIALSCDEVAINGISIEK
ncbi:type VI secretion system tube protein TssD [Sphingobacterium corticis]|uniref:Type VI secretion system tube protein TssD n=1 Tax=Sphingobacterium corticis TaxID=1812823 RepID=A0ABW5NM13_9SPHI